YDASIDDNAQWMLYPAKERNVASDPIWENSEIDNANRLYRLVAQPPSGQEADRLRRMKLMDYQPSGMYVRKGDKVSMTVRGLTGSPDGLTTMVGAMNSYEGATEKSEPQLVQAQEGANSFTASRNGMIYFHYVDSGFSDEALPPVEIEITSGGIPTPLFIAGQTTPDEWRSMMSEYASSPYVEMMNDKVLITVTRKVFQNSKLTDPSSVLDLLGKILGWYDDLSGLDGS
ncbi:S-layer protein, partial [Candidatus Entotheonella serta]